MRFFLFLLFFLPLSCIADRPGKIDRLISEECFSGEVSERPFFIKKERAGTVSANRDCWDTNPDSMNRHKGLPGGVDFLLCLPDFAICKEENERKDVAYLSFLVPPKEFVTRQSAFYKKKYELVRADNGVEIYTDKDKRHWRYVSTSDNAFNISCIKSKFGGCDMMGLVEGDMQYFLQFHYQEGEQDWHSLHNKAASFIRNAVEFQ